MFIDQKSTIAGIPALIAREVMRKIGGGIVSLESIAHYLKMDNDTAQSIVERLSAEGYIEGNKNLRDDKKFYTITLKGNSLGSASATKPLTRKTAAKKLTEFMERVFAVNSNEYYLYKVSKVIIFGSYLSESARINDIDIAIEIIQKFGNDEQQTRDKKRIEEVAIKGRSFKCLIDMLAYPQVEVFKYLKNRSRAISLHPSSDGILEQVEQKVIYDEGSVEFKRSEGSTMTG